MNKEIIIKIINIIVFIISIIGVIFLTYGFIIGLIVGIYYTGKMLLFPDFIAKIMLKRLFPNAYNQLEVVIKEDKRVPEYEKYNIKRRRKTNN